MLLWGFASSVFRVLGSEFAVSGRTSRLGATSSAHPPRKKQPQGPFSRILMLKNLEGPEPSAVLLGKWENLKRLV